MHSKGYVLHPACRVRRERFGLLFYDARGPKLLFAETGNLLAPEDFREGGLREALLRLPADQQVRVQSFLSSLASKGFLREQPLC